LSIGCLTTTGSGVTSTRYVVTEANRLKWRQSSPPPTLSPHNDDVSCDEDVDGQRDDAEEWRELQDLSKRTMLPLKLDPETGSTASSADYDSASNNAVAAIAPSEAAPTRSAYRVESEDAGAGCWHTF